MANRFLTRCTHQTNIVGVLSLTLLSTFLTACGGGDSDHDFSQPAEQIESALPHGPIFDPANASIPTPNDLLMGADGTLDIPNDADADGKPDNPVIAAINALDGASTSNPMVVEFGMPLDPASLVVGETIRIFEVTKTGLAVTGVVREVTAAEIIVKVIGDTTLALVPFPPLKESASFVTVLTNGIKDTDGKAAQTPSAYSLARSNVPLTGSDFEALEPVRQHIGNLELIAKNQGVDTSKIVLSWAFSTQSISAVLNSVAADAKAGKIVMTQTPFNTSLLKPAIDYAGLAFNGSADVHIGTLDIPYYLDKDDPLGGFWKNSDGKSPTRYNAKPIQASTLTVPVMMTTPNAASNREMPEAGWPIIMYQHGITRYRSDMLIYADTLAKAGYALIAIDLPLHGVPKFLSDGSPNPFHASHTGFTTDVEPTFDVDFVDNETSAPGPDGKIDSSGAHYINLQSLLTARDNTSQGVSNLLVLRRSLGGIANIDSSNVGFIAHSLGGVVGVPYLGVEEIPTKSALITTGGSITTIIRDSAFYGPVVKGGFLAGDPARTEADYAKFLQGSQWVLDSSDPINYSMAAAMTHSIFMTEVIGNGGIHKPDQTVPNSATEGMAALMGAQAATLGDNIIAVGATKIIRFTQGDHSSILDPSDDVPEGLASYINVFKEMHSQLASFFESRGNNVAITDGSIIKK